MLFRVYARIIFFVSWNNLLKKIKNVKNFASLPRRRPTHHAPIRRSGASDLCVVTTICIRACACASRVISTAVSNVQSLQDPGWLRSGAGRRYFFPWRLWGAHSYTGVCFTCAKRPEVECAGGFCFALPEGHTRTRTKTLQIVKQEICWASSHIDFFVTSIHDRLVGKHCLRIVLTCHPTWLVDGQVSA